MRALDGCSDIQKNTSFSENRLCLSQLSEFSLLLVPFDCDPLFGRPSVQLNSLT